MTTTRADILGRISTREDELADAHNIGVTPAMRYRAAREIVEYATRDTDGYSSHLAAEHYAATGHLPRWMTIDMLRTRGEASQ